MEKKIHPKKILAQRQRRLRLVSLLILLSATAYLVYWWNSNKDWVETRDAYVIGNPVALQAQVVGTVVEIRAENTQFVNQGEILIRLNKTPITLALEQAKAELAETVRRVANLFNRVKTLRWRIATHEAALRRLRHDLERYHGAVTEGAVSAQRLQNTQDRIRELEAKIRQTQAGLEGAKALVQGTTVVEHPLVMKAKNALKRTYREYVWHDIVAPVSGYVAKRRVQVGEAVKPSMPLLAIVPLDYLWVEANFKETELARVRPGQPAHISVDIYGSQVTYHGMVEGFSPGTGNTFALLPIDYAVGNYVHVVERIPVRIALPATELRDHPLRPGLSTVARVNITHAGYSILRSLASTRGLVYRTSIYEHELAGVEDLIDSIIKANLVLD
jgi:membrane fusion protein (multidrug efflux system)